MDDSRRVRADGSSRATSETVAVEEEESRPKIRRGLGSKDGLKRKVMKDGIRKKVGAY